MAGHKRKYIHLVILLTLALYLGLFPTVYMTSSLRVGMPDFLEVPMPDESELLYGVSGLEPVSFEGEAVYRLEGWAFAPGSSVSPGDFAKQVVLLELGLEPYVIDAETLARVDVTEAFASLARDLDQAGFRVYISALGLPPGRYRLGILYSHPKVGRLFGLTSKYILRTPNTMQLHDLREGRPEFLVDDLPTASEMYYGIDQFSRTAVAGESVAVLDGWAFFPRNITAPSRALRRVVLVSGGSLPYLLDLETMERPDVTEAFQHMNWDLDHTGFRAHVSETALRPGVYRIGILQAEAEGDGSYGLTDLFIQRTTTGIALLSSPPPDRSSGSPILAGLRSVAWKALLAIDPSGSLLMRLLGLKAH